VFDDPEVTAVAQVIETLEPLDPDTRRRVLALASSRYSGDRSSSPLGSTITSLLNGVGEYTEFVDLFHAFNPKTEAERALVAGYWFQVLQGRPALLAQEINDVLKDLGHRLSNVTDALTKLENRRPALARQVSKSGRSRQARKTYRLTREGISAVERAIGGGTQGSGVAEE
jgi:hypothetical protein